MPGADRVVAFAAPAPGARTAPTPVTSPARPPSSPPPAAPAGAADSSSDLAAIAVAGLVILAGLGWFVRRQRIRARG
ncbi:MAG: hypothetical protein ACRDPY_44350 [Streptosporangiaceae bacterium]